MKLDKITYTKGKIIKLTPEEITRIAILKLIEKMRKTTSYCYSAKAIYNHNYQNKGNN